MKLSTFLLVVAVMFVFVAGSCGAMGMSFTSGDSSSADTSAGGARSPGTAGKDVAKPTAHCAADIRQQGLPAKLNPEGQSRGTHLTPRSQNLKSQLEEKHTDKFTTIGRYRKQSAYSDDHGCGRALDVMVTKLGNKANGKQTQNGYELAQWVQQNADVLGVHYIIFRECIWNAQRASESGCGNIPDGVDAEGWRQLEDRGGNTMNHYDHVHISVW